MTSGQKPNIIREHLFATAFFAALLFAFYLMLRLLAPFSAALIWASIISLALHPLQTFVLRAVKHRVGLAAAAMTAFTLLLVVGPALGILTASASQAMNLYGSLSSDVQSGAFMETADRILASCASYVRLLPFQPEFDVKGFLLKSMGDLSSGLAGLAGSMLKGSLLFAIDLLVMLVALFFFFRDGASYYQAALDLLPFKPMHKQSLARKLHETFTAVIQGVFLIALIQGLMTGVGFALFGVPFPVFWGFLAAVLALLPVGGAALVWLPGALFLFLTGSAVSSLALLAWGVLLVTLPDTFLKPILIGRKTNINGFLLFIGILGGLNVYGVAGVLFGPLIVTLLTALVVIYREEYAG